MQKKKALETNPSQLKDLSEPNFNPKTLARKIARLENEIDEIIKYAFVESVKVDVSSLQSKIALLKSYRVRLKSLSLINEDASIADLDKKTVSVKFRVSKFNPNINID